MEKINKEKLYNILYDYFDIGDSYSYNLVRNKKGFSIGTITIDDFEEFDESIIEDLAIYIIQNMDESDFLIVSKYKVGQTVWYLRQQLFYPVNQQPQLVIESAPITKVYVGKNKITYYIKGRSSGISEKYLFSSREDAESHKEQIEKIKKGIKG